VQIEKHVSARPDDRPNRRDSRRAVDAVFGHQILGVEVS
jgi:hypothetical protein